MIDPLRAMRSYIGGAEAPTREQVAIIYDYITIMEGIKLVPQHRTPPKTNRYPIRPLHLMC